MTEITTPSRSVTGMLDPALPHQRAIVGILAIANQYQVDAAPLLHGLAAELPKRYARPVQILADRIAGGMNPVQAITGERDDAATDTTEATKGSGSPSAISKELETEAFDPRLLPPTVVLAMQLAHSRNCWSAFCSSVLHRESASRPGGTAGQETWGARNLRFLTLLFFVGWIFSFFLIKILPEFYKMLEEFQIAVPKPLALLGQIGEVSAQYAWVIPFLIALAGLSNRSALRGYLRRFSPLSWQRVEVPEPVLRQRALALVAEFAPQDNPVIDWESLSQQHLISRSDATALSMTGSPDTQAWLLRWSAVHRQNRLETRTEVWGKSLLVVAYTALGLLVFLVCLSVMSLLITLAAELSKW